MRTTLPAAVTCRRVGLSRLDQLLALEEASFSTDRISRRNLRHLLRSSSACCIGACSSGELVGSMVVLFRANCVTARIYSIAVASHARGRGIGRRMMRRAEYEARQRGCRRMRLEVRMENTAAIRLYESLGFSDTEVIPGYYEDGAHAMVYRKELS
jgi:ribosomal-protein-alanine acetyltransferase